MNVKRIVGGLAIAILVVGCGSSKDSTATTSGANGGGGSTGSGGSGGSGGISEAAFPEGVILLESDSPDGAAETFVSGEFQAAATAGCKTTIVGACGITDCRSATVMPKFSSAGKLTITGSDTPIVANPGSNGAYEVQTSSMSWSSNRMLTVKASGGDVPAFTVKAEAPPLFTLTTPDFDTSPDFTIDRTKSFDVVWKKAVGKVEMLLVRDPDKRVTMQCIWDAAANKATIPASTLAKVPADAGFTWGVIFRDTNETQTTAGKWTVTLAVSQIGQTPQGAGSDAIDVVVQ